MQDDRPSFIEMWGFSASTSLASLHAANLTFHLQSSCPTSVLLVSAFTLKLLGKAKAVSFSLNTNPMSDSKPLQARVLGLSTMHAILQNNAKLTFIESHILSKVHINCLLTLKYMYTKNQQCLSV